MDEKTKETLDESQLTKISFSLTKEFRNIVWTREGEEFKYNDQMYDVVKTEINSGVVTYYCLTDNNEKELQDNFCQYVKSNTENGNKARAFSLSKNLKYISYSINILPRYSQSSSEMSISINTIYDNPFYLDESPPPRPRT